ncbi:hypothetical protein KAU11_10770 [Candidatus Babeliales bacterium]|nr:hypothetical protein [Candidatus Babeliales bacterium]
MNWFSLVGSIFKPAVELIDNLHTSDEEKLQIKQEMFELQVSAFQKAEEYEVALLDAKKTIITAEAQSQSWIARNWRPITMLTFLGLVVADALGLLEYRLADEAWTLLQLGLGGYIVGRSGEKVSKIIKARSH